MEPTTGFEPVDLFLTKEALYLLSYVGVTENSNAIPMTAGASSGKPCARLTGHIVMERETRIELATFSLEG